MPCFDCGKKFIAPEPVIDYMIPHASKNAGTVIRICQPCKDKRKPSISEPVHQYELSD